MTKDVLQRSLSLSAPCNFGLGKIRPLLSLERNSSPVRVDSEIIFSSLYPNCFDGAELTLAAGNPLSLLLFSSFRRSELAYGRSLLKPVPRLPSGHSIEAKRRSIEPKA